MALVGLLLLTAVNMFGITESAKLLMPPAALFIASIFAVIIVGPFHPHPVATIGTPMPLRATTALGFVLILKAFAAGCSAVTGVEAIANGVPAFRRPRVRTAQRTEVSLAVLLGVMLVGLAILVRAHHVVPRVGGVGRTWCGAPGGVRGWAGIGWGRVGVRWAGGSRGCVGCAGV